MKWEGLNLHIENLIPGIVTLILVVMFLPQNTFNTANGSAVSYLMDNSFFAGGVFVATSYLVGIFTVAISRCIIDSISAAWPRPRLLRLYYHNRFKDKTRSEINDAYREATQKGLDSKSEYKRTEMKNRRERGRLLRSSILPMALFLWWVTGDLYIRLKVPLLIIAVGISIFLYAYAELAIYQESVIGDST